MATIPKRVLDRIGSEVRKYQKVIKAAKDRDINESDTVIIITDMLTDIFGYDKYEDITSEFSIRGTYCDLALKVEDKVHYLMEVKAIGLDLKDSHLRQAIGYGAQHGIQWVILTNGEVWEIHRIKFEMPVSSELLCEFNFLELSSRKKEHQDILYLLCKEGISKAVIEDFHEHIKSVNKFIIGAILQTNSGLTLIRRELKRVSPGIRVELEEIKSILIGEVLKRDILEGDSADKAKIRVKKAAGKSAR